MQGGIAIKRLRAVAGTTIGGAALVFASSMSARPGRAISRRAHAYVNCAPRHPHAIVADPSLCAPLVPKSARAGPIAEISLVLLLRPDRRPAVMKQVGHKMQKYEEVVVDTETNQVLGHYLNYYRGAPWFYISLDLPTMPCMEMQDRRSRGAILIYSLVLKPIQ